MGYRYAILGAGRQGVSAGYDLGRFGDADEIRLYDIDPAAAQRGAERLNHLLNTSKVRGAALDASQEQPLKKALEGIHATLSALPYAFNPLVTLVAIQRGSSLCDLGGNTDIVREQLKLDEQAKKAGVTLTPDCGMGPGLNISLGVHAMSFVEEPEELFIWDGGLPQNPILPWNYRLTFHINGLTNEYYGDAHFLRNGKVTPVPTLTELESLEFPPPLGTLEAAVTSGGLSTAPWTFAGTLKSLENKTLRFPGHWQLFQGFKQLGLFEQELVDVNGARLAPRDLFHKLLEPQIREDALRDICVIRTQCKGKTDGRNASCTLDLVETYDEETGFTAMEKLTGWHLSIVAILAAHGKIPRGAVPVELALTGDTLAKEAERRNWSIKNTTVVDA